MRKIELDKIPPTIGPYRLEKQLGSGGMGAVYRAHHERLDRPVALKQIRPDVASTPSLRQRFLREARMAAQLSHPHIVQVYDILKDQGSDWIVMELAEGEPLSRRLAAGPLETGEVLALGLDIARGLAAAHARGIVHRDLKAENVVVDPTGHAKILDFGLAKLQATEKDASVSSEGEVVGTPRAMSPEQASGHRVDHRSDLFSLGVLFYECLTSVSPFQSKSVADTLAQICTHLQQPARELRSTIPEDLSKFIDKLLEKDPNHRPQSSEDVVVTLQRLRGTQQTPVKILFVDDEPDLEQMIRQLYRKQIRKRELELEFATDGREALAKIEQDGEIALVMSDIRMPQMDGLTLLDHVQKLDRHLLTVIISAFGDMENIRAAMNLGAFDFLNKPIDFEDLELTRQKAVAEVLRIRDRHRLREENRLLEERNRQIREALRRHLSGEVAAPSFVAGGSDQLTDPGRSSVVKAEIGGFKALSQNLAAPDLFAILNHLFSQVLDVVTGHGGTVCGLRDGAMTIVLGPPTSRDSASQRAVDCSLALRLALDSISEHSVRCGGPELTLRVETESDTETYVSKDDPGANAPARLDEDQETLAPGV